MTPSISQVKHNRLILLEIAMSVRPRTQDQLILGARNVVGEIENLANDFLRIIAKIVHKAPIGPASVIREKQQFDIAGMTKRAQILNLDCDELATQIGYLLQCIGWTKTRIKHSCLRINQWRRPAQKGKRDGA